MADHAEVLAELREYLRTRIDAEAENRASALSDLRFLAGDQWPEQSKRQRTAEQRPALTINKLPSFLHQITNELRQNRQSIKVHPVDDHADPETAEVIQSMIRHIEYASDADVCYDTSSHSAASIGFGYFRLVTDYCAPDSFDQEVKFRRIRNPFSVYMGPHEQADGSDMTQCAITAMVPGSLVKRQYPDIDVSTEIDRGLGEDAALWYDKDAARIAEYYRIEYEDATLIALSNGETGWKDELNADALPPGITIARERKTQRQQVRWYKCTGAEVLEEADIPCQWIPVIPVYGDELDIEGKIIRSGLIRHAKDPAQAYNFWMTSATEEVALRPKVPYIMAEGQEEGHEAEWQQANVRSFPYLTYKPTTVAGQLAPPPQRAPMADVPQGVLALAMHASDELKAVTGIFDASLGARGNETSGKAILARQNQGGVSNFHFADNLTRAIRHAGRCILSMIPHVYDTARVVRLLGEDGTASHAKINTPEMDERTGAIARVLNDMTVGQYDVTISTGASYQTMRQEAAEAMVQMGQAWPKLMEVAGDKVVRSMDWPGAEEIAERIAKTIPPEIRGNEGDEQPDQANMVQTPQGPIPAEQAGQVLAQLMQQVQQMGQALQEAQAGTDREQIKAQAAIEVARINAESRGDAEELKGVIQLLLAKIQPPAVLAADVAQDITVDDQQGPQS